jgi:signal transduction histidine kinase
VRKPKDLEELGRYKALAQMIGGFVHQLRTPIHVIQASAEDLASQRSFMPNFKPQAELIGRSAQRLEASVNALLNFVKGEKLSLRPGTLQEVLHFLDDFLRDECHKRSVKVEKKLQSQFPILLDPHHLEEALLNLFTNALQAMPKGGTLTVATEDRPAQKKVILTITDTGIGMDKKALAKIAQPFHTTKKSGMGLGLFFTQKILDEHRAKLSVESQKGKGTKFTISFPAASKDPSNAYK